MATQWGRKETVAWPPQVPLYTYGTLILTIPIAFSLLFGMYMMKPFLARNYTGSFIKSAAGAEFNLHGSYRLIYLGGGKRAPRLAVPGDFASGSMTLPGGKQISVALSPAAKAQGTGKTTVLSSIREGAEQSGYAVEGFAPTSRAAAQLREAGIGAATLQSFLARGCQGQVAGDTASRHLYMLDESSLASTKQMRAFLDKLQPQDRVLVIGDTRQHQGVDAGRPFEQMQDGRDNTLTVEREDGQTVTYDPKRLKGANVYQEVTREFATGDRIQFTAPDKQLEVSNRDLATIVKLEDGQVTVQMDTKGRRFVTFDPAKMRSFDHGYAVTSHSSQGLTEGRVIANIDTDSSRSLINTRLAYVAVSRASEDVRIYTNDAEALGTRLATEISKTAAVDFRQPKAAGQRASPEPTVHQYATPDHRLAAVVLAYAERPDSTIVVAPDLTERHELNQLIRTDLQAQGRIAPDSKSFVVHIQHSLSNPQVAAQYTPGDLIQYRQGSPTIDGIPHNSIGTVVSVDAKTNSLTVQTPSGDEATYNPNLTKTMTAESTVYRQEQREIAPGDRIQFTEADSMRGLRKGELGTVITISNANDLDVKLDKGSIVQLNAEQARHIEHGYAVESIKPDAPERVLFTQEAAVNEREAASLSQQGRDLNLYTSDGSVSNNQGQQNQVALPQQEQIEAPANVIAPELVQNEIRRSLGR